MIIGMIQAKKHGNIIAITTVGVAVVLFMMMIFLCNIFHFNYKMNSDIGAEAVLGRLIWDSQEIIPASWYPSTETRIIATPQAAALFYGLTGNMDLSMGLACCTMTIGIVLAIWLFMKKAGSSRISCLLMCLFCLGFAGNIIILELLYVFAGYYAIHVIAFFFILNCYSSLLQKEWKKSKSLRRKMYEKCIIGLILAFLLGMQGTRGILITFGPLFGIEMIRIMYERICRNRYLKKGIIQGKQQEKIPFLWVSGLLVLSFLGTQMPFSSGQEISRNIRNGFSKLIQVVLPDTWRAIGFSEGVLARNICLGILVLNVMIWVIVLLVHILKWQKLDSREWCFLVTAASPVVTAFIVAFTTVESSERYYFMWIFSMAFAVILSFEYLRKGMAAGYVAAEVLGIISSVEQKEDEWENSDLDRSGLYQMNRRKKRIYVSVLGTLTAIILIAASIVIGINVHIVYQPILKAEEPTASNALEVVNYLKENGCEMAYSTFENANKMTALANGKVNVYAINSFETMDICKWLTDANGYPENGIADRDGAVYIVPEARMEEFAAFLNMGASCERKAVIGNYNIWVLDYYERG